MLCITQDITDPYFNIASEEYLLKQCTDDVFMLYQNTASIIVGKHQNTFSEINYRFAKDNNIPVVRRLSGGGTVFHDLGNLNFSFIQNSTKGRQIDFKRFIKPILEVLHQLNVPAVHTGRNDLLIDGLKCSGNAEHVYKNRTLHHGTLLFNSKLDLLRNALKVQPENFEDKAVKSVRSQVTNISEHLPKAITLSSFRNKIINYVESGFAEVATHSFSETDHFEINKLIDSKYQTWDWNYGYSPKFLLKKKEVINGSMFELMIEVDKGIILAAEIKENGINLPLAEVLIGLKLRQEDINNKLSDRTPYAKILEDLIF